MVDRINNNIGFNPNPENVSPQSDTAKTVNNSVFVQQTNIVPSNGQKMVYASGDDYEVMSEEDEYLMYSKDNTDKAIVNQMQEKIDALKKELEAQKSSQGLSGAVCSLFGGGASKLEKQISKMETSLQNAINDPSAISDAYENIMGEPLTDEVRSNVEEAMQVNSQLTSEDREAIKASLLNEADNLGVAMDNVASDQGWFSKGLGKINNFFGFGTSEKESKAQIEALKQQIESLDPNSEDFAAQYKAITGKDLTAKNIDSIANGSTMLDTTNATESIYDYQNTQATLKEVGSGLVTGLVTATAVIAAPITGGASIALGAAVGGTTKVLIEGTDTIGTSKKYSFEQGVLDFAGGAIEGAVTGMTLGTAGLAGKGTAVFKNAGKAAAKTGTKMTLKQAYQGAGKSILNAAKIASFSAASSYTLDTLGKNALYDATGNYTVADAPSNVVQNDDGTYSIYYKVTDSNTGDNLYYQIEKVDSVSQDENGNMIKGNVLETSRSNDFSLLELGKQVAISSTAAAVGVGIGRFTNNIVNTSVLNATGSSALGNIAEMGADGVLSMGADYVMADVRSVASTGQHIKAEDFFTWDRIIGEGRNQIRGLLIGIATSKVNASAALGTTAEGGIPKGGDSADGSSRLGGDVEDGIRHAGERIMDGDTDGARDFLRDRGMSESDIDTFVRDVEDVMRESGVTRTTRTDSSSETVRVDSDEPRTTRISGEPETVRTDSDEPRTTRISGEPETVRTDSDETRIDDISRTERLDDTSGTRRTGETEDVSRTKQTDARDNDAQKVNGANGNQDVSTNPVSHLHQKITGMLNADSAADVEMMVDRIMQSGATREEAIATLQYMTQFGSVEGLKQAFESSGLTSEISAFYSMKQISANTALQYFCGNKSQINLPYSGKVGYVLDDAGLSYLEGLHKTMSDTTLPDTQREKARIEFEVITANSNLRFINFEGFDSGVSIYSQGADSASTVKNASDIITRAREIQASSGGTFDEAVHTAMSEKTLRRAAALGINLSEIKTISTAQSGGVDSIVKNLRPLGVSEAHLDSMAEELSRAMFSSDPVKAQEAKQLIIQYLETQSDVYSPKRLGAQMIKMQANIEQTVGTLRKADGTGYTMDDVYYLVPYAGKSYEQVLLQYAKVNGIDPSRFIYDTAQGAGNLPDGKIYVAIDDVVGSGASMLYQGDGVLYQNFTNYGDRHIIMAPIVSGQDGADAIQKEIAAKGRIGQDFLLIADEQVKTPIKETEFYKNLSPEQKHQMAQIISAMGTWGYGQANPAYSIVFPYMAPDNDAGLPYAFYSGLLLNPNAMKSKCTSKDAYKIALSRLRSTS